MLTARTTRHTLALVLAIWSCGCARASSPARAVLAAGEEPSTVLLADFDRNGFLDIAVANAGSGKKGDGVIKLG